MSILVENNFSTCYESRAPGCGFKGVVFLGILIADIFSILCESALNRITPSIIKGKGNLAFIYRLLNIYSSGIWLWYMQALFINRVKQNRCLKSENSQPMVATILPPCSGKQMWMWCSVVSSPAWWLITPSPIPEAARCQLLLRAGQLRYLNVSARKLPPKLQCQEMINIT